MQGLFALSRRVVHAGGRLLFVVLLLGLAGGPSAWGQDAAPSDSPDAERDRAWSPIVEQEGVRISYIFYRDADTKHNGVVLRLENDREVALEYSFVLVFRAPAADTTTHVQGMLEPGEIKTGDRSGLFWVPFTNEHHRIGEIGLRTLRLTPVQDARSRGNRGSHPDSLAEVDA